MAQNRVFSLGGIGAPCCCGGGPAPVHCIPCDIPAQDLTLTLAGTQVTGPVPGCVPGAGSPLSFSYPMIYTPAGIHVDQWQTACIDILNNPDIWLGQGALDQFGNPFDAGMWRFTLTCDVGFHSPQLQIEFWSASVVPGCATAPDSIVRLTASDVVMICSPFVVSVTNSAAGSFIGIGACCSTAPCTYQGFDCPTAVITL